MSAGSREIGPQSNLRLKLHSCLVREKIYRVVTVRRARCMLFISTGLMTVSPVSHGKAGPTFAPYRESGDTGHDLSGDQCAGTRGPQSPRANTPNAGKKAGRFSRDGLLIMLNPIRT